MSAHNMCFYKENQENTHTPEHIAEASLDMSFADVFFFFF